MHAHSVTSSSLCPHTSLWRTAGLAREPVCPEMPRLTTEVDGSAPRTRGGGARTAWGHGGDALMARRVAEGASGQMASLLRSRSVLVVVTVAGI